MDNIDVENTLEDFWAKHAIIPNTVYRSSRQGMSRIDRIPDSVRMADDVMSPQGLYKLFPTLGAKRNGKR